MILFRNSTFSLLFSLLLLTSAHAEEALNAKSRFLSRALLASPATGLSFMTPRHFRGAYDAQTGTFFLKNRDGLLLGVYGFSEATLAEVNAVINAAVKKLGIALTFEKKEMLDANTEIAFFQTVSPKGEGIMVSIVEIGNEKNALAMIGFDKADKKDFVARKIKRIVANVEWRKPTAQAWRKKWTGKGLRAADTGDTLSLCEKGAYRHASKNTGETHRGAWRVIANLVGESRLALRAQDGRVFSWPIQETEQGVQINGVQYQAEPNPSCG